MADRASAPDPRAWVGQDAWPAVDTVDVGEPIVACYYVDAVEQLRTRHDKPYLKLRLFDRHGAVDGRVWDDAERIAARVRPGTYIGIRGRVELFNDQRQLRIEEIAQLRVGSDELGLFLPSGRRDPRAMAGELAALLATFADVPLRTLLERLLGPDTETGRRFRQAPAAKRNHHAYIGGLLEHTLSVAGLCDALARHYGGVVDRDLLIAGALLHDVGKVREIGVEAGFPYTDEGKLLGHILLGLQLVAEEARRVPELAEERLLLLLHLIASHQGRHEWQSPREPRILEGLLLHYADDLDSKMHQAIELVRAVERGWTTYDRAFGREFFRHGVPAGRGSPGVAALDETREPDDAGPGPTLDLFAGG